MNNKRNIIIGIATLIVITMIGYSLFSETLNVAGTTTAKGDFNMEIISASITNEVGSKGVTVNIVDGNTLSISVPKLEYPGAYVDISYTLKNKGRINSYLDYIEVSGISLKK